ncbi:alpha/beta fold hydrolase [Paraburkholderia sp. Cpub6]|uniref:alpha/beta fold hydrolase n=1 Tax=Paraburkholderia sp. Cpub6 TaxID=2723094 RepID=UPI001609E00E|nr:alpha/beta hydrolase [Paraburkholderia sp. Cpub6]
MNDINCTAASQAFTSATSVIALHCSGSGAAQWRKLGEALGLRHAFVTPEHYGCESTGPWSGERAFTLADEAARTVGIIDASCGKVHLVGHSYGGGVALRAALERPERIASLTLYEPSAFHLLKMMGSYGAHALAEIIAISKRTADGVSCGDYRGAAATFVDYWSGLGAWDALRPSVQAALTRWAPKAPLDFRALLDEHTPANAYATLRVPALIMRGQHAPVPTRAIAERLPMLLPAARLAVVEGAGHMGPVTHADKVNAAVVRHIAEADATI